MKTKRVNLILVAVLLATLMLTTFMPHQAVQAKEDDPKSELVRFTFINKSNRLASLRLYGLYGNTQFYYFLLMPGEAKTFTPVRGEYRSSFYSCGLYVNDELNLSKQYTLVVPKCGTVADNGKAPANLIDGGKIIKLVKVNFVNKTEAYMKVILRGPQTYVFSFDKDQEKSYTISKGDYDYTVYGCGGTFYGTMYAHHGKEFEFKCP